MVYIKTCAFSPHLRSRIMTVEILLMQKEHPEIVLRDRFKEHKISEPLQTKPIATRLGLRPVFESHLDFFRLPAPFIDLHR